MKLSTTKLLGQRTPTCEAMNLLKHFLLPFSTLEAFFEIFPFFLFFSSKEIDQPQDILQAKNIPIYPYVPSRSKLDFCDKNHKLALSMVGLYG